MGSAPLAASAAFGDVPGTGFPDGSLAGRPVTNSDGDVPDPPEIACSSDGGALGSDQKFLFGPLEEFQQVRRVKIVSRCKV